MIKIDLECGWVSEGKGDDEVRHCIDTQEAFSIISKAWLRAGWDTKYVYSFTWLGRPIIQLPEDMVRMQEVIYSIKPDVIIETGVAHGGSLVFYAGLCKAIGKGKVVGVDIEIRLANRKAIESHELFPFITLIEGSSIAPGIVKEVQSKVGLGDKVLVILDSNHSKAHVAAELEAYCSLVSPGSYIVATDGIMKDLQGAPRSNSDWPWNNPYQAAKEFVAHHPEFQQVEPTLLFNEGDITKPVTYWPGAWLQKK